MLVNYKNIGDTLTTAELNAYASLIAHNKVLKDSFKLKNGVVNGVYGDYEFDLSNASIVDNGILITDETLSNDITVKLSNPTQYATYTLHFTVIRYGDVNILEEPTENIETFDLTVDLITDTTINIPLESLQEYDIILFDSQITIKHDLPEIKGAYVTSLSLTSDKLILQNGESATLTVTALDLDSLPVPNKSINIYKNGTLLDTLTTDSNGQATTSVTASSIAEITLVAKYKGTVSSEELVLNSSDLFNLSLTSNKDIMQTGETATLTATLSGDDTPLAGESISFEVYHNNVLQETLSGTTDSNGVATVSYVGKGTGHLNIRANVDGIIQSEIYSITDATFYDEAILGHKNTNWNANRLVVSETDNTGTLLYSENGQGHYWANAISQYFTGSFACEFDLISYSDTNTVSFRIRADSTNNHYLQFQNLNIAPNSHIKLIYDGTSFKYQINDNTPVNWVTASYNSVELALRCYGANDTIKYANFVIYPI